MTSENRAATGKPEPGATPRTRRGERTRAALVRAAREVFERDGYLDARVADIAAEAGMATGSFYTYFTDKAEVFTAVMAEILEEMLHPQIGEVSRSGDPVGAVEAANRAYLLSYRKNAKLMALMEQMSTINDDFLRLRLERANAFADRNAAAIRRLQQQGLADPELDPLLTAQAVSAMVSRMAYLTFVHGAAYSFDELLQALTRLWANALRIPAATDV